MSIPPSDTSLTLLWRVRDLDDEDVGGGHKAILFALVACQERDKRTGDLVIRPSVEQLARAAGVSRATVIRLLGDLKRLGYVRAERTSRREVAQYTITLPERSQVATSQNATSHTATSQPGERVVASCGASGLSLRHSEDLPEDLSEDPPPRAREDRPEETAPNAAEGPASTDRRQRDLGVRRTEQPYFTAAFAEGVSAVTRAPYVVPRDELRYLDDAIDAFAPEAPAGELGGSGREAWVRASAEQFRHAVAGREQFHRGGGPRGWLEWLGNGQPSAHWLAMTPAEREAEAEEVRRRERAATRERAQRAQEREADAVEPVSPGQVAADLKSIFGPRRPAAPAGRAAALAARTEVA